MSRGKVGWVVWTSALALSALSLVTGCGSSNKSTAGDSGTDSGGTRHDGGTVGMSHTSFACTTTAECMGNVPSTTPANCATGSCDVLQGTCVFSAKDADGDGHTAFNCKSNDKGVSIANGDDCDDQDPNIYPGHPESCDTAPDGGPPPTGFCTGQRVCESDGSESGCTPTLTCTAGEACIGGTCSNSGCFIAGTVYTDGAVNPANPCLVCASSSSTAWSNNADGTSCGAGEVCSKGVCGSQCYIGGSGDGGAGGTVYASGAVNPDNPCQTCQPTAATAGWSSAAAGTMCQAADAGAGYCNAGSCYSACFIAGTFEAAGTPDPNNPCESCLPGSSTTGWTQDPDSTPCGNGEICVMGVCQGECDIGGVVYASGAANPMNSCQTCQPGTSTAAWTDLANGTSCGAGEVCNVGSCAAGCAIAGIVYTTGSANPTNACQICQPSMTTTAWTNESDGTSCGFGQVCEMTTCVGGCYISGVYYAALTLNPADACQMCQPTTTGTAWTNVADGPVPAGGSCGSGQVCHAGACAAGCVVGTGGFIAPNTPFPSNACQTCQPTTSTTTYTNLANGATCGNGQICTGGQCGSACIIGGTSYPSGTLNPTNACQSCQPGMSTTGWSNVAGGTGCGFGDVCNATGTCSPGCFIAGVSYAPNVPNPANACQSCQVVTSITAWTNFNTGQSCGAAAAHEVCTNAVPPVCISGCFISNTVYPAGTLSPDGCLVCQPSNTTTAWSQVAAGTACGVGGKCGAPVAGECTVTYNYTGNVQNLVIPTGITQVAVIADGASGSGPGGLGGETIASLTVASGETLAVYVGGSAGYNGGGSTGNNDCGVGYPGGGASDVRTGGTGLGNRVIVAGGGGGFGYGAGSTGGAGGNPATGGVAGNGGFPLPGGGPGTQTAGGANGGCGVGNGTFGLGGGGGGSGGGGWYGGGGAYDSGGGGGSSYAAVGGATFTTGTWTGNGKVTVTY